MRQSLDEGDCFSESDVYFANAPWLLLCNSNKWHLLGAIQLEAKSCVLCCFACVCVCVCGQSCGRRNASAGGGAAAAVSGEQ